MKSGKCPHCNKKVPVQSLKNLRKKRAIYCPFCTKPIRVNQKSMILTAGVASGIASIINKALFNVPLITSVFIAITFAIIYSFIYLNLIGLYFPLEKAKDDDLLM